MQKWEWNKQYLWERQRQAARKQLRGLQTSRFADVHKAKWCIRVVALYYGLTVKDLIGPSHKHSIVFARSMAIYLIYEYTNLPRKEIGVLFRRDRTTISVLLSRFGIRETESTALQFEIDQLRAKIRGSDGTADAS